MPPETAGQPNMTMLTSRRTASLGATTFLAGSVLVQIGNYAYNVVMARALGPALFSDLVVIVTLLLAVTLVASTLQTTAAKVATEPDAAASQRWMQRRAGVIGVAAGALLAVASGALSDFFNASSPWPFIIFGLGLPALFAQAVDRGFLLGATRFGRLTLSYQTEMWMRLGGAVALVAAGLGINGAVAALSVSFLASWLVTRTRHRPPPAAGRRPIGTFAGGVALLGAGEMLVNHSDLLMVKHFAEPVVAGAYGAVAVIGRVPFFAAWSLAALAFPYVVAGNRTARRWAVASVAAIGALATAVTWLAPEMILNRLFGDAYTMFAASLGPYTLATSLFAVARTIAFLELAAGRVRGGALLLGAGVVQIGALWAYHGSIVEVGAVQVIVMTILLGAIMVWSRR